MSDPTVPVVAAQPAPAAEPADPLDNILDDMKAQTIEDYARDPDGVGSARVQTLILNENYQEMQQVSEQLTTIAAAFKPATPVGTLPEGLGYAAAALMRAIQSPFVELQQHMIELGHKLDNLEARHAQFAGQVETQFKHVETNISKEMSAIREALKDVKELQRGHELALARLTNLERQHKLTAQHLQRQQKMLGKLAANVEGWQEHERALDRHVEEIVIVEPHDDGRGPKRR